MAYATVEDVKARTEQEFDESICGMLLEDASLIIDSFKSTATDDVKKMVSCRMVIRALPSEDAGFPIGATQGTMSALGYSQTWTVGSGGSTGELYVNKTEKKLLGVASLIGSHSPIEDL